MKKPQNTEQGTQNAEHGSQNTERETRNTERGTWNAEASLQLLSDSQLKHGFSGNTIRVCVTECQCKPHTPIIRG